MTKNEFAARNDHRISDRAFGLVVAVALIFCPGHSAQAGAKTWVAGGATGDWGIASNWNSNSLPALADDVLFDNSGQSPLEDIFLSAPRTINSLTINLTAGSNQSWNLGADSSINARTLTLASGNISVLSTSGSGTYVIGATSGTGIGTGTMTLATSSAGFTFDDSRTNGGLFQINATVSGLGTTVTKTGVGTVVLTGANTYTGATTVGSSSASGGTLNAGAAGALGSTSSITVNSGGTLLLSGSGNLNRVNDAAPITLGTTSGTAAILKRTGTASEGSGAHTNNGGVTSTGTNATGLGALTLNSNSTLDYGTGGVGTLVFASFTPNGHVLNITNYTTTASAPLKSGTDGTDDRLIFNQDQLTNLTDFSFGGISAIEIALGGGFFEITPVTPVSEPSTWCAAALAAAIMGFRLRHRMRIASLKFVHYLTNSTHRAESLIHFPHAKICAALKLLKAHISEEMGSALHFPH